MKEALRKLFSPILNPLEQGEGQFAYQPSHRKILMVIGVLFSMLSAFAIAAAVFAQQWGGLLPGAVFLSVGVVCAVVAFLGSDRAVARLWKSK
ncbi:hypothetical protein [Thalassolituus marinus]|uniref:Uncharacterized protein n=1 Tax=Thalassolituus marinus TaxID=671053 RepID=A0ABS7ZPN9_9GAMM|nr:hypothetical protein [Thalassolituus marinus]MCA6063679.1 hypothetical protein [Thalassolituus marinus]